MYPKGHIINAQLSGDEEFWSKTDKNINVGHWIIETDNETASRLYGDDIVLKSLGVSCDTTPEKCYSLWQENVFSSHIAEVQRHIGMIINGQTMTSTYPWMSPTGQTIYVRSIATRDNRYEKGIRLLGTFEDVTDIILNEQMTRKEYIKSDYLLQILAGTFEAVHIIEFDKQNVATIRASKQIFCDKKDCSIESYLDSMISFIHDEDRQAIINIIQNRCILDANGNCTPHYSKDFKSDYSGTERWYNALICYDKQMSENDMIIAFRDITELMNSKKTVKELKRSSEIDGLTGVLNRITIEKKINKYIRENVNQNGLILLLDLDNFKAVNDELGHMEGDKLLIETAEKLESFCRITDKVGRLGGDEFIVFFEDITDDDTDSLVTRILENIKTDYISESVNITVTASIGVAHYPNDGKSFDTLYQCADIALYHAKRRGKNCYSYYSNINK